MKQWALLGALFGVAACGAGGAPEDISGDGDGDGDGLPGDPDSPDASMAEPPRFDVVFTTRTDGTKDPVQEDKLIELLELAVPGSQVRVSLFHITRTRMAEAFVAAADRGVDLEIVLDDDNRNAAGDFNDAVTLLRDRLGGRVSLCETACIGDNINHNKMFLFSELSDGSRDVVVQSSANLTNSQMRLHNNLVVVRDDTALYAGYLQYWSDQKAERADPDYYRKADGDLDTRLYMFPRNDGGDTILSILGNVDCFPGSEIHLAMSLFTAGRVEVARELGRKRAQGCAVHAVVNQTAADEVKDALAAGGVDLTIYPTEAGVRGIHSKYLLVNSRYFGSEEPVRIVWTGSHNYTVNALRHNDETVLKIVDDGVYDAFRADWDRIAAVAE